MPARKRSLPPRRRVERRERVDVREVEPPGEQLRERVARGRAGSARVAIVPDHGDADGAGVEALRVGADDVPVDAAVATLVDRAVAVDEKVVADVVPAVRLARGRAGSRARSPPPARACRRSCPAVWWTIANRSAGAYCGAGAADRLVRAPGAARHDRRRAGGRERAAAARATTGLRTNVARAARVTRPRRAVPDRDRRPHPDRVAEAPAARGARLGGCRGRAGRPPRAPRLPGAPAPVGDASRGTPPSRCRASGRRRGRSVGGATARA